MQDSPHPQAVLIVDDEPTVRTLVTDVLENMGFTVLEAADARTVQMT